MPPKLYKTGNALTRRRHLPCVSAAIATDTAQQPVRGTGDSIGLIALTTVLWKRKAIIVGAAITGLLIGLGVGYLAPPTYRARTSLQLEGFNNDQFLHEVAPIAPSLPNASPENYLQNAVKLLESETLAKRVGDKLGNAAISELAQPNGTFASRLRIWVRRLRPSHLSPGEQRIKSVQQALTVRTSLQSQVIELFYDSFDRRVAAQGANAAASEFVELNREARWQLAQDTTEWLSKQASALQATLEKSNQELQDFARSAGLVFAGKQNTLAEDRMRQVQDALAKAEADRAEKQARLEAAQANHEAPILGAGEAGPLRQYESELENLRRELAQLQTLYTPTNYKVQRVQAQIGETERSIQQEREDELARLRTEYVTASGLERLLSQTHALQLKMVEQQMENERLYNVKQSEVEATQRLYEAMLQKVKEAGAASAMRTTNVRMIDPARLPSVPFSPNQQLNMAIGLALGALFGIGMALLCGGSVDHKVQRPGELCLHQVPELGVIPSAYIALPRYPSKGLPAIFHGRARELAIAAQDQYASLWNESFRATLTSILFSEGFQRIIECKQRDGRALVVTSLDVMEGKTTVVTNLGLAAAQWKRRVLLIDADLRRPRLHERLDLPNGFGLTDMLQRTDFAEFNRRSLDASVLPTRIPNLWVLPSGPVNEAASSLLYSYSSNLRALLRRFRRDFDLVLIDTPPMRLHDGRILGRLSDGLIMVVRANRRSKEQLRSAYLQFAQDRIPVLGSILNDCKMDSEQIRSYRQYQDHYGPAHTKYLDSPQIS